MNYLKFLTEKKKIIYIKKKPSGDFVFVDLKVYALGILCIIGGIIYILDKLKII